MTSAGPIMIVPKDREHAKALLDSLQVEIENITAQLTNRAAQYPEDHIPVTEWTAYRKWRATALNAATIKRQQRRAIKGWLATHPEDSALKGNLKQAKQFLTSFDLNDPTFLLYEAVGMILRLKRHGDYVFTKEEDALLSAMKAYVRTPEGRSVGELH